MKVREGDFGRQTHLPTHLLVPASLTNAAAAAYMLCLLLPHQASRVLRPGGMLVVAFGQDCFRDKALAGWLSRSMQERTQLVQQ